MILENSAVDNSFFATVWVERICERKCRDICWLHRHCHCYGIQVSKNRAVPRTVSWEGVGLTFAEKLDVALVQLGGWENGVGALQ